VPIHGDLRRPTLAGTKRRRRCKLHHQVIFKPTATAPGSLALHCKHLREPSCSRPQRPGTATPTWSFRERSLLCRREASPREPERRTGHTTTTDSWELHLAGLAMVLYRDPAKPGSRSAREPDSHDHECKMQPVNFVANTAPPSPFRSMRGMGDSGGHSTCALQRFRRLQHTSCARFVATDAQSANTTVTQVIEWI